MMLPVMLLADTVSSSYNLSNSYTQTVWPAGHRDSANSDYVPVIMSRENRLAKHLLPGHPIFWAPLSGPEGNYYVTSGKGQGASNLHAFDGDGNLLWKSQAQATLEDLDGWAIINAPVIASNGDLYVGDQNQLWAFKPDGRVKWVSELTQYGVDYGFMTAVFSRQDYVGGISSNGKVIFFRQDDGSLAMPVLDLPGGDGPQAKDTPPDDLWKGLMDPELKPIMFNLIQGWAMEVANTPAVHPKTGRIYITAYGIEPNSGLLYGIDVFDDHMEIAFKTDMGQGSGTSPAISHDGKQVYALDELGHMIAIDAENGELLWRSTKKGGGAASPSVGPDESIYTLFQDHLIGFNYDGSLKFEYSYNQLCAESIEQPGWFWGLFLSDPVAFLDSLFTVDANGSGWMNIVCGYHIKLMASGNERTLVPIPRRSMIVAVDLESGQPINETLTIPETSEGFILPLANGNQFITLSGAISSIFYNSVNPILPERLQVPYEAKAGLLLLEPQSRQLFFQQGLEWLQKRVNSAQSIEDLTALIPQIDSTISVLDKLIDRAEVNKGSAEIMGSELHQIRSLLSTVNTINEDDYKEQQSRIIALLESIHSRALTN